MFKVVWVKSDSHQNVHKQQNMHFALKKIQSIFNQCETAIMKHHGTWNNFSFQYQLDVENSQFQLIEHVNYKSWHKCTVSLIWQTNNERFNIEHCPLSFANITEHWQGYTSEEYLPLSFTALPGVVTTGPDLVGGDTLHWVNCSDSMAWGCALSDTVCCTGMTSGTIAEEVPVVTCIVLPVLSHNVGLMIRSRVHYSSQQVVTLGGLNPHSLLRYERGRLRAVLS